tara:strand:+ start:1352 stop:1735 length:384 start_codon:yes stop_codon:yes gene_type:complete
MTEERDEDNAVMRLMNALITKMETMDSQMHEMRADLRNPDTLLKRAGFVRTKSPSVDDVWGDPLRGDRGGVIEKAGDGTEIDVVNLPSSNEEWHDMDWEDIHALAKQAGAPTESGFSTNRRVIEAGE